MNRLTLAVGIYMRLCQRFCGRYSLVCKFKKKQQQQMKSEFVELFRKYSEYILAIILN